MKRSFAVTAMAVATLCGGAPWALAEMAGSTPPANAPSGNDQIAAGSSSKASASASASSSSSSTSSSAGKPGCRATAESTAEAVAGDQRAYDSDRQTAEDVGDGCSATARSRASTGGKAKPPTSD